MDLSLPGKHTNLLAPGHCVCYALIIRTSLSSKLPMKGPSSPLDKDLALATMQVLTIRYRYVLIIKAPFTEPQSSHCVLVDHSRFSCKKSSSQNVRSLPHSHCHTLNHPFQHPRELPPLPPNKSDPCKATLIGEELPTYLCHRKNKGVQALLVLLSHCKKPCGLTRVPHPCTC